MKDNRAQISLEYILIFAISLLVLMIFTLPLAEDSIKNTVDVSDSLNARYCMSNIAQAIKEVYGEGQGSKRTLDIDSDKQIRVSVSDSYISCSVKLKSNSNKQIKENFKSNLKKTSITLNEGKNAIIVEWPVGSENMLIYKK